jgi:hypothetical protein
MVADTIIPVVENGSPYDAGDLELRQGLVECRRKRVAASQLSASVDAAMIAQNLV